MTPDDAKRLVARAVARGIEGMGLQEFLPNVTWATEEDDPRALVRAAFQELVDELTKRGT